jgi:NADPH:quinone reductase-like Zn-dependent oxidoreductase
MKAIIHSRYGPPDALELQDIEKPSVNEDGVLVRVHAAAGGKGDWLTVQGLPYVARLRYGLPNPKHPVPGFDVAGRIEAVGSHVAQLQPGDAVFGWCDGSFAQYASVPEGQLAPKPANLSFDQAAAVPISGFAALQALRDTGGVQPGQTVVIIGASGGVGSFAVQLAKAFGAEVTGVCSTKSLDMVRSIGADQVIDYTQQDFTRTGQRYDLILEMAGNRSLADLRRALGPQGDAGAGRRVGVGGSWGPAAPSEPSRCPRSSASGCARSCPSRGERTWWCSRSSSKPASSPRSSTGPSRSARLLRRSAMSASAPPKGKPSSPCEERAAA